jgi:nucleoid DNA-binding protein
MVTDDCANSLRENGRFRIANFGKFEVSKRTGQIIFSPYTRFLDQMEFEDEYSGEVEEDDEE